ncbi:hypothetical protein PR003_g27197 [Phytophthora rubi]|uniref:Secreted protein n=1 Tax=Phytophthora rubi TaxID=129364 RepID=A0A6A4C4K3_9STRA|nr:hypothetical protein PR003_g27197 [Phytophthora rubi]
MTCFLLLHALMKQTLKQQSSEKKQNTAASNAKLCCFENENNCWMKVFHLVRSSSCCRYARNSSKYASSCSRLSCPFALSGSGIFSSSSSSSFPVSSCSSSVCQSGGIGSAIRRMCMMAAQVT